MFQLPLPSPFDAIIFSTSSKLRFKFVVPLVVGKVLLNQKYLYCLSTYSVTRYPPFTCTFGDMIIQNLSMEIQSFLSSNRASSAGTRDFLIRFFMIGSISFSWDFVKPNAATFSARFSVNTNKIDSMTISTSMGMPVCSATLECGRYVELQIPLSELVSKESKLMFELYRNDVKKSTVKLMGPKENRIDISLKNILDTKGISTSGKEHAIEFFGGDSKLMGLLGVIDGSLTEAAPLAENPQIAEEPTVPDIYQVG